VLDFDELEARRAARRRRRLWRRGRRRALGITALAAFVAGLAIGASAGTRTAPPSSAGTRHRPDAARLRHQHQHHHRLAQRTGLVAGQGAQATVPILMYHVIAAAPLGAPFPQLYVPPEEFAAQMRALYDAGWTAVTMDQVRAAWHGDRRLPPGHPIVISFDNGYSSQFHAAYPVLRHLHWKAVENLQLSGLPRSQGGLSSRAVSRLVAAGWELDTQGYTHADLVAIGRRQLIREVVTARRTVQRRWHVPANWFCYPSGHYDARVVAAVRTAGYVGATTVVPGWARAGRDPYRLPRLRVVSGTSPAALLTQIAATRHAPTPPPAYGT
jgi:peptidoglycan/xylan/chitin deacetylase (PgdA/CDA1 family)